VLLVLVLLRLLLLLLKIINFWHVGVIISASRNLL
jgi:hypothetical protein